MEDVPDPSWKTNPTEDLLYKMRYGTAEGEDDFDAEDSDDEIALPKPTRAEQYKAAERLVGSVLQDLKRTF